MLTTLNTRKPIDKLQAEDLLIFPIWEFAEDEEEEQDETWVRPVNAESIPLNRYALSVATEFQTASGWSVPGLVGMSTEDEIEITHGVFLHAGKYLFIPPKQDEKDRADFLSALDLQESQVFPIGFSLRVRVEGESVFRQGEFE